MRRKKALYNTIASFLLQIVTIVCGFIVPRLIIGTYGSDINGLISSITQFLSYIALAEAGIGGVVRAALYKPLAENDTNVISGIVKSTESFFRKIAYLFLAYMVVLAVVYPYLVNKDFDWLFTAILVIIIGLSTFVQYYFGMTYMVLVQADQRRYITSVIQMITIILNAVLVYIFIKLGASIHVLKIGTAFIYMLRPFAMNIYIKHKYKFKKDTEPNDEAIKQRWDGLGHHIAYFVNLNTDVVILTLVAKITDTISISAVSVYSVYYAVVMGIEKIVTSFSTGMDAAFGNMIAKNEKETLTKSFNMFEFVLQTITTSLFTCAAVLIIPFVKVYTANITDAEYIQPLFAYILVLAQAMYCFRIPYYMVTLSAGHYRQTRNGAFVEAGINVIVSSILVFFYGLIGVAIGTLVAMTFRTFELAIYASKNIVVRSMSNFIKRILITISISVVSIVIIHFIPHVTIDSYLTWFIYAIECFGIVICVALAMSAIFCRAELIGSKDMIYKTIFSRKKSKKI